MNLIEGCQHVLGMGMSDAIIESSMINQDENAHPDNPHPPNKVGEESSPSLDLSQRALVAQALQPLRSCSRVQLH